MKFKAVYLGHSRFMVNKSKKKKKIKKNDEIALKKVKPKVLIFFLICPCKHML